jgi:hypothetical protein
MEIRLNRWVGLWALGLTAFLFMGVSIPHTFVAGTSIRAADVNANFAALKTAVDALEAGAPLAVPQSLSAGAVPPLLELQNSGTGAGLRGISTDPASPGVAARYAGTGAGSALELDNGALKVTGANQAAFIHTATVANKLSANGTDVDHPLTNGDATAILLVTQKLNPSTISYNNSPIGVYYNALRGKWEIFNQNNAAIPTNAQFNVFVIKR